MSLRSHSWAVTGGQKEKGGAMAEKEEWIATEGEESGDEVNRGAKPGL